MFNKDGRTAFLNVMGSIVSFCSVDDVVLLLFEVAGAVSSKMLLADVTAVLSVQRAHF